MLRIGLVEGQEAYLLSGVAGALRESTGHVVIANCASSEIRIFDEAGIHVRTVGGRGAGPGEFQYLRRIFLGPADTIGAYDGFPQYRVSIFAPDGSFVRTAQLLPHIEVMGQLSDGLLVGRSLEAVVREPGPMLRATTLYRLDSDGAPLDSLWGLPGREGVVTPERRPRPYRMERIAVMAVLPDRIVFGDQKEAIFTEYNLDLRPARTVVTVTTPEPVTDAARRRWDETQDVAAPIGGVRAAYADEFAPAMPAYRHLVAGATDWIWVQDPDRPGAYPLIWTAYRDGRPVARAELPVRFFPTQFGANWVLGVGYDDRSVERVELFHLQPGTHSEQQFTPREAQPPDVPRCGAWTSR